VADAVRQPLVRRLEQARQLVDQPPAMVARQDVLDDQVAVQVVEVLLSFVHRASSVVPRSAAPPSYTPRPGPPSGQLAGDLAGPGGRALESDRKRARR